MKWLFPVFLCLFYGQFTRAACPQQAFDRAAYYEVMKAGKLAAIEKELTLLGTVSIPEKEAYEGALLMRKSGLVKVPAEKLKFFKKGRIKLETALLKEDTNGEYHFLRLSIQEHAPKVVKYSAQLETDRQVIIRTFKDLPAELQQIILDYSKDSKILSPQDL